MLVQIFPKAEGPVINVHDIISCFRLNIFLKNRPHKGKNNLFFQKLLKNKSFEIFIRNLNFISVSETFSRRRYTNKK